jgi:hypothetical protein
VVQDDALLDRYLHHKLFPMGPPRSQHPSPVQKNVRSTLVYDISDLIRAILPSLHQICSFSRGDRVCGWGPVCLWVIKSATSTIKHIFIPCQLGNNGIKYYLPFLSPNSLFSFKVTIKTSRCEFLRWKLRWFLASSSSHSSTVACR